MSIQNSEIVVPSHIWGRASRVSILTLISCLLILMTTPLLVFYFYIAAFHFDCSLVAPIDAVLTGKLSISSLFSLFPKVSLPAAGGVLLWIGFQVVLALMPDYLHHVIPSYQGGHRLGSITPAGNCLSYQINGLQAWFISQALFLLGGTIFNWFSLTLIFDYWGALLWAVNIIGFILAIYAYVKAFLFPSYPQDRKFSNNGLYDFFMGVELNPRIGPLDLKLFFNGRPGIVAWTLINGSFAAAQYVKYGYVSNSMILVNFFQALYVLYFFWKEAWYLKTIDIHHDHFGWMLAWGDCVWLPYMYTLQGLFLVFHPVQLTLEYATFVLALGLAGFFIFASANNQKDKFRKSEGELLIWGRKPQSIACQYKTEDGCIRKSQLLVSGWWGIARHMNYTGDLLLSLAYSLACGITHLLPYFYIIFLFILLVHRCIRDEKRCSDKYGSQWKEYCSQVPYRFLPYVW